MMLSPIRAMPVSALSAMGSQSLPKRVTRLYLRATLPSTMSVMLANTKISAAPQRQESS
jgi:hypothetical protein